MVTGDHPLTAGYMYDWLKDPQAMKPGNLMRVQVSDQDMLFVLAYLSTLK